MEWFELLKQVKASKTLTASLFITSSCIIIGSKYLPELFPILKNEWKIITFSVLIFSGTLLTFWLILFIYEKVKTIFICFYQSIYAKYLSNIEKGLLLTLSENPDQPINLSQLNYESINMKKIHFYEIASILEKKGLITIYEFDKDLISLTKKGQKIALKILHEENA